MSRIELKTYTHQRHAFIYTLPIMQMIGSTKQNSTFTLLQFYELSGKEIPQLCTVTSCLY